MASSSPPKPMASPSPTKTTVSMNEAMSREVRHLQTQLRVNAPLVELGRQAQKLKADLEADLAKANAVAARVPELERQLAEAHKRADASEKLASESRVRAEENEKRAEESEKSAKAYEKWAELNKQSAIENVPDEKANVHLAEMAALEVRINARTAHIEAAILDEKNATLQTLLSEECRKLSEIGEKVDDLVGSFDLLKEEKELETSSLRSDVEKWKVLAEERESAISAKSKDVQKLKETTKKAEETAKKAEAKTTKVASERDKLKKQIEVQGQKLAKSSSDVLVWKSKAETADKKLAASLAEIQASAVSKGANRRGMQTGIGNTFSPAPLAAGTALGEPVVSMGVEDIASESRSRFTDTLPQPPVPLAAPFDFDLEKEEAPEEVAKPSNRSRRRDTILRKDRVTASGPLKKRPRGRPPRPEKLEGDDGEDSDGEDSDGGGEDIEGVGVDGNGESEDSSDGDPAGAEDAHDGAFEDTAADVRPQKQSTGKAKKMGPPRKRQRPSEPTAKAPVTAPRGRGRPRKQENFSESAGPTPKARGPGRPRTGPSGPAKTTPRSVAKAEEPKVVVGRTGRTRKKVSYNYDRGTDVSHEFDR